jgi:hypothetical protein
MTSQTAIIWVVVGFHSISKVKEEFVTIAFGNNEAWDIKAVGSSNPVRMLSNIDPGKVIRRC